MTKAKLASSGAGRSAPGPRTHRAVRIVEPGRTEVLEVESELPKPGEVRYRVEGCGVCASNVPFWEGRSWFGYPGAPGAPGHEGWGVVEAVGEGVEGVRPGDRVAALSHHAFAERDVAPEDHVVPLPRWLPPTPFPGEPLGCAVNIFRRAEIRTGQRVAVVGAGFIGALLVGLAKRAGATVIALSRRGSSLEAARRFGADEALSLERPQGEVVERVTRYTEGALCERVVEATGKEEPLNLAALLTGVRGRLVVAGFHQDGPRTVDLQLWNWRGLDVINAHERDPAAYVQGIRGAIDTFGAGDPDPSLLYSHILPLDRAGEALDLAAQRPEGFTKALVAVP